KSGGAGLCCAAADATRPKRRQPERTLALQVNQDIVAPPLRPMRAAGFCSCRRGEIIPVLAARATARTLGICYIRGACRDQGSTIRCAGVFAPLLPRSISCAGRSKKL